MKSSILFAVGILAVTPLAAQANNSYTNDMKVVVGGALSRDQSNFDDVLNDDALLTNAGIHVDDSDADIGTNVYVGLRFNPYITARLGYRNFGDFDGDILVSGVKRGQMTVEADGVYVALDGMYPLTDRFSIGATLGVQSWNGDMKISGLGGSASDSEDGRDLFYGAQAAFRLTDAASLVASYNFYSFDVEDISKDVEYNALALGLEFAF